MNGLLAPGGWEVEAYGGGNWGVRACGRDGMVGVNDIGRPVGESHPRARLSDDDVELIRQLRDVGMAWRRIAEKFEVSVWTVRDICSHRRRQFAVRYRPVRAKPKDQG